MGYKIPRINAAIQRVRNDLVGRYSDANNVGNEVASEWENNGYARDWIDEFHGPSLLRGLTQQSENLLSHRSDGSSIGFLAPSVGELGLQVTVDRPPPPSEIKRDLDAWRTPKIKIHFGNEWTRQTMMAKKLEGPQAAAIPAQPQPSSSEDSSNDGDQLGLVPSLGGIN